MKIAGTITLLILCLTSLSSCDKSTDCETIDLVVKSIESEFKCADTRYGLQAGLSEEFYIIRSQQDFENKVTGSCNPQIDFSLYDLVIGRKGLSSGNSSINYKLKKDCKVVTLEVTFNQGHTMDAPTITYHALIPS